jgi:hypothetical protein
VAFSLTDTVDGKAVDCADWTADADWRCRGLQNRSLLTVSPDWGVTQLWEGLQQDLMSFSAQIQRLAVTP